MSLLAQLRKEDLENVLQYCIWHPGVVKQDSADLAYDLSTHHALEHSTVRQPEESEPGIWTVDMVNELKAWISSDPDHERRSWKAKFLRNPRFFEQEDEEKLAKKMSEKPHFAVQKEWTKEMVAELKVEADRDQIKLSFGYEPTLWKIGGEAKAAEMFTNNPLFDRETKKVWTVEDMKLIKEEVKKDMVEDVGLEKAERRAWQNLFLENPIAWREDLDMATYMNRNPMFDREVTAPWTMESVEEFKKDIDTEMARYDEYDG